METTRDLGRVELWQESLERSLARRGKLGCSSLELGRLRPDRDLNDEESLHQSKAYWQLRRRPGPKRSMMPVLGMGGVSTLALLAATLGNPLGGRSASGGKEQIAFTADARPVSLPDGGRARTPVSPGSRADVARVAPQATVAVDAAFTRRRSPQGSDAAARLERSGGAALPPATVSGTSGHATRHHHAARNRHTHRPARGGRGEPSASRPAVRGARPVRRSGGAAIRVRQTGTVRPALPSSSYVNPLAGARVSPERIDQGVDYAGSGTLAAIGAARITHVATSGTGWPGAFIEYRLSDGSDAGRYVYYAEGVSPAAGLHVGEAVPTGAAIARIIPGSSSGIEIGWGAGIGTETYAAEMGQWSSRDDADSIPSPAGRSFSALIASLGGPPGRP